MSEFYAISKAAPRGFGGVLLVAPKPKPQQRTNGRKLTQRQRLERLVRKPIKKTRKRQRKGESEDVVEQRLKRREAAEFARHELKTLKRKRVGLNVKDQQSFLSLLQRIEDQQRRAEQYPAYVRRLHKAMKLRARIAPSQKKRPAAKNRLRKLSTLRKRDDDDDEVVVLTRAEFERLLHQKHH